MNKWITKDICISIRKGCTNPNDHYATLESHVSPRFYSCMHNISNWKKHQQKILGEDTAKKKRKETINHLALRPTELTENPDLKKAFPSTTGGREPTVLASSRDGRDAASRWGESKESKNKDGRRVNQYTSEISLIQETWTDSVYNLCWTCTTILNSHHLWQLFGRSCQKTTSWSLLRVYNSFRAAFWDRFAAVNFIEHNQKKCCNLWSCMNLRKSWIFVNPWSKSPQEHVLHVRQEARKGRPFNPAFSRFTKNQVKIPQIPLYTFCFRIPPQDPASTEPQVCIIKAQCFSQFTLWRRSWNAKFSLRKSLLEDAAIETFWHFS